MEEKEQKTFDYYLDKIRERIEELELLNETLQEVVKVQHEVIIKLSKGEDKDFFKGLSDLLD